MFPCIWTKEQNTDNMKAVIQRVSKAEVSISNNNKVNIGKGLLILLGIEQNDSIEDMQWLADKILNMRIFNNEQGKMQFSVQDISGELLVVSQFTLCASTKKGNRPSFISAALPMYAENMYLECINYFKKNSTIHVSQGYFGKHMQVELLNDGPVTIILDSKNKA